MSKEKCVHCTTQEEWDFVLKCFDITFKIAYNDPDDQYPTCIFWKSKTYSDLEYALKNHIILTFTQWEKLTNNYLNNKQLNNKGMIKQINEILEKTYSNPVLRRTTVPLFMSNPGIGKTNITEAFVRKWVESKGNKMVSMVLPNLMPNECVGGVFPNQITKVWEFYDSEKLSILEDGDCLFLDEVFNGTLKQTLDAMLNVLGQRRLGSGKKMADVMIVAASNPQGLINLTPQIKERFVRYDLKFESSEYQAYLKGKYGMPEKISAHLCTLIHKEKFDQAGWDYVTPRSVEKAINQIGCEMESPYGHILIPFLSEEIVSPIDITSINIKQGDKVPYIELLKLIVKNENLKETEKQLQTKAELIN